MFEKLKERYRTSGIIRRAIDTYPGGICFTAADGRPILANKKINEICYALTGHTVTNGEGSSGDCRFRQTGRRSSNTRLRRSRSFMNTAPDWRRRMRRPLFCTNGSGN